MVTFEIQKGYFKVWDGKTAYDMFVLDGRKDSDFDYLPDLNVVYNACKARGYTPEQVIDFMLHIFHVLRLFKSGYFQDLSTVVGFVGPRGSGKSVGAAAYAIVDYLLAGKPVWSNMNIEIKVKYRDCEKIFRSEPLDKASLMDINDFESQYANGLIVLDELNIEIGDSRRSMSNQMLWFDFMLQEVRKRKMNICYMLQAEEWAGSRSRWQTDIYVVCRDMAFINRNPNRDNLGRHSRWRLHDMSGIVTGELRYASGFDRNKIEHFQEIIFWNTPFWGTYNTTQMQSYQKFDPSKENTKNSGFTVDKNAFESLVKRYLSNPEVPGGLLELVNKFEGQSVLRADIYEVLGIEKHGQLSETGELLRKLGFTDGTRQSKGRTYLIPDKKTFAEKLNQSGVKILAKTS